MIWPVVFSILAVVAVALIIAIVVMLEKSDQDF